MPPLNKATPATKKMLDDFKAGFLKALDAERTDLASAPKVHDTKKGEYVEEVDPKLADRHLEE